MTTTISGSTGIDKVADGADMPAGSVIQVVSVSQDTPISTSSVMDYNVLPVITQGAEIMSTSFTPASATSHLLLWFNTYSHSNGVHSAPFAIFETDGNGSTCIGAIAPRHTYASEAHDATLIMVKKSNTSTTPRTYSVRFGAQANNGKTTHVNTYPRLAGAPQTTLIIQEVSE